MKRVITVFSLLIAVLIIALSLCSCAAELAKVSTGLYICEKEYPDYASLRLSEDGTGSFCPGLASSRFILGDYTVSDGVVRLTDKSTGEVFAFSLGCGTAVFDASGSVTDGYMADWVPDGSVFVLNNESAD